MASLGQVIRFVDFRGDLRGKEQKDQRREQPLNHALTRQQWIASLTFVQNAVEQTVGRIASVSAQW